MWKRQIAFLASALVLPPSLAAEISHLTVDHDRGAYSVSFDVLIDANPAKVRRLLTDYDHLDRLSETVTESRVLAIDGATTRVKVVVRACVLFLCKTLTRVEDARTRGNEIETEVLPEQSDFAYAQERWRISRHKHRTRVEYKAAFVPDFYVPPFIGPLLITSAMRSELETAAKRLEALAR